METYTFLIVEWCGKSGWLPRGGPFLSRESAEEAIAYQKSRIRPECLETSRFEVVPLPPPPADACRTCRVVGCEDHKTASPQDAAAGMLKRYSSPKKALEMAHFHMCDYNPDDARRRYWRTVKEEIKKQSGVRP